MSLLLVKRTFPPLTSMSVIDPKRTSRGLVPMSAFGGKAAQPIERLGIFVVTDRAQRTRKTPKKLPFSGVCQVSLLDDGAEKIFLANGNELIVSLALGQV